MHLWCINQSGILIHHPQDNVDLHHGRCIHLSRSWYTSYSLRLNK
jgi:hypothetical protein